MRIGIGIAVVVAIGLIWSVAVMSQWVPVTSAEMSLAAVIQPYEAGRHKAPARSSGEVTRPAQRR